MRASDIMLKGSNEPVGYRRGSLFGELRRFAPRSPHCFQSSTKQTQESVVVTRRILVQKKAGESTALLVGEEADELSGSSLFSSSSGSLFGELRRFAPRSPHRFHCSSKHVCNREAT